MNIESVLRSGRTEKWLRVLLVIVVAIVLFGFVRSVAAGGSTRISGIGYFPEAEECTEVEALGADFANKMEGDLKGCLYVFVGPSHSSPSGTYIETGTELYVGGGGEGDNGTFETTYRYTAKFGDSGQHYGRCQHPIVTGSGTDDYEGVKGRIDFKDEIVDGVPEYFPYKGNLKLP